MPKKGQLDPNASKRSKAQRKFNSSKKQKKNRVARNTARRRAKKAGKVRKGDGKDIDHKKPLRSGGKNGKKNLRVRSRSANRSDNGSTGGRKRKGMSKTKGRR